MDIDDDSPSEIDIRNLQISLQMLTVETNDIQSNSALSAGQTRHADGGDWQEDVYQQIKVMKEMYVAELSEMYQKISTKLQQHDSLAHQVKSEQLEKLKLFKNMLEHLISVLEISKSDVSPGLKQKLDLYEKQIINLINVNRPRKAVSSLQQGQLLPPHMHSMQRSPSQITQVQSHENRMNLQLQSVNLQVSVATMLQNNIPFNSGVSGPFSTEVVPTLLDQCSSAETRHANGGDWQEEAYQQIKVMKEMYVSELNEMYQKIDTKLKKHDSVAHELKSEPLEKLKMFKNMLERVISVLQISKSDISPGLKQKLGLYEKQIINFIHTNRPRKPVSSLLQGQLLPPHMHSVQQPPSQITQAQSYENQMNPQLQSMNLQVSGATMQQNNMTSLQQNSMSLSGDSTAQQNKMTLGSQPDMQQRLQASGQVSGTMLQQKNIMDQQKHLHQFQSPLLETSSTSLDSTNQIGNAIVGDWQEEVYERIKAMKELYLPELCKMYEKIASKLQLQHGSLPKQPKSVQLDKLKMFKTMLERLISFLQISKSNIKPNLKHKLGLYEKQIINFINTNRPRQAVSSLQQGQLLPPHMHFTQQQQSQITQLQSHENQMSPQ